MARTVEELTKECPKLFTTLPCGDGVHQLLLRYTKANIKRGLQNISLV